MFSNVLPPSGFPRSRPTSASLVVLFITFPVIRTTRGNVSRVGFWWQFLGAKNATGNLFFLSSHPKKTLERMDTTKKDGALESTNIHFECVYLEYEQKDSEQRDLGKFQEMPSSNLPQPQVYQNVLIDKSALYFCCETFGFFFEGLKSQKPNNKSVRRCQVVTLVSLNENSHGWLENHQFLIWRYTFIHGWVFPDSSVMEFFGGVINHKASFEGAKLKQVLEQEDLHP